MQRKRTCVEIDDCAWPRLASVSRIPDHFVQRREEELASKLMTVPGLDSHLPGGINVIGVAFLARNDEDWKVSLDEEDFTLLRGTVKYQILF